MQRCGCLNWFWFFKKLTARPRQEECAKPDPRSSLAEAAWRPVDNQGRSPSQFNCSSLPAALIIALVLAVSVIFTGCLCLAPISWCLLGEQTWQLTAAGRAGSQPGAWEERPVLEESQSGLQAGRIPTLLGQQPREWGMTGAEKGQPLNDQKLRLPGAQMPQKAAAAVPSSYRSCRRPLRIISCLHSPLKQPSL